MVEDRLQRRLAAILAADVVGYSRLMEQDEAGTFERLRNHRKELFEPLVEGHRGRIFKLMGDGLLVEFGSVVDAVECAVALQQGMADRNASLADAHRIELRIGINLGDVIAEVDDVYGDGVNIAARLQTLADPGGVVVSGTVYDHLQGKFDLPLDFEGEQQVKNIARPVRVYRVRLDGSKGGAPPPLPDRPSIAVLPFQNLSDDPEQEYFADGMVEEIITALSRMRWLFVIARNSSFAYKGRVVDVKQVGRELGVRYVLEGSVRRAGNRIRIAGQLIDTSKGTHMWADRFDGGIEDVFDLQDRVAASVVGAIAPKLEQAEIERVKRKSTESLDAYESYLRGLAAVRQETRESITRALKLFNRAIELDPDFASAYAMAAWCFVRRKTNGWMTDPEEERAQAERFARRAAELGKDDAVALTFAGFSIAYIVGDLDDGAAMIDRALVINPNLAAAWNYSGWIRVYRGELDVAIEHQLRAMRLSPLDALIYNMQGGAALAHLLAGRYDQAISLAQQSLQNQPDYRSALRILAASSALDGRGEDAKKAIARLYQVDPAARVSNLVDRFPLRRLEDIARFADGLRKAGLLE
jgi:adenylate cyclase